MKAAIVLLVLAATIPAPAGSSTPPGAEEALRKCLAYHDPNDVWSSGALAISAEVRLAERLASERGYTTRVDHIFVDNASGRFGHISEKGDDIVEVQGYGETFHAHVNGSDEISESDRQTHRLTNEQMARSRNYFIYMYGLPMKLRDAGTRLDPVVNRVEFAGSETLELRVTYPPTVGNDIWYFYLNPETFAMVGCRFYHDEAANDGEFIVFEEEVDGPDGLRLPRFRLWHMNLDGEYIASDEVLSIDLSSETVFGGRRGSSSRPSDR